MIEGATLISGDSNEVSIGRGNDIADIGAGAERGRLPPAVRGLFKGVGDETSKVDTPETATILVTDCSSSCGLLLTAGSICSVGVLLSFTGVDRGDMTFVCGGNGND